MRSDRAFIAVVAKGQRGAGARDILRGDAALFGKRYQGGFMGEDELEDARHETRLPGGIADLRGFYAGHRQEARQKFFVAGNEAEGGDGNRFGMGLFHDGFRFGYDGAGRNVPERDGPVN